MIFLASRIPLPHVTSLHKHKLLLVYKLATATKLFSRWEQVAILNLETSLEEAASICLKLNGVMKSYSMFLC